MLAFIQACFGLLKLTIKKIGKICLYNFVKKKYFTLQLMLLQSKAVSNFTNQITVGQIYMILLPQKQIYWPARILSILQSNPISNNSPRVKFGLFNMPAQKLNYTSKIEFSLEELTPPNIIPFQSVYKGPKQSELNDFFTNQQQRKSKRLQNAIKQAKEAFEQQLKTSKLYKFYKSQSKKLADKSQIIKNQSPNKILSIIKNQQKQKLLNGQGIKSESRSNLSNKLEDQTEQKRTGKKNYSQRFRNNKSQQFKQVRKLIKKKSLDKNKGSRKIKQKRDSKYRYEPGQSKQLKQLYQSSQLKNLSSLKSSSVRNSLKASNKIVRNSNIQIETQIDGLQHSFVSSRTRSRSSIQSNHQIIPKFGFSGLAVKKQRTLKQKIGNLELRKIKYNQALIRVKVNHSFAVCKPEIPYTQNNILNQMSISNKHKELITQNKMRIFEKLFRLSNASDSSKYISKQVSFQKNKKQDSHQKYKFYYGLIKKQDSQNITLDISAQNQTINDSFKDDIQSFYAKKHDKRTNQQQDQKEKQIKQRKKNELWFLPCQQEQKSLRCLNLLDNQNKILQEKDQKTIDIIKKQKDNAKSEEDIFSQQDDKELDLSKYHRQNKNSNQSKIFARYGMVEFKDIRETIKMIKEKIQDFKNKRPQNLNQIEDFCLVILSQKTQKHLFDSQRSQSKDKSSIKSKKTNSRQSAALKYNISQKKYIQNYEYQPYQQIIIWTLKKFLFHVLIGYLDNLGSSLRLIQRSLKGKRHKKWISFDRIFSDVIKYDTRYQGLTKKSCKMTNELESFSQSQKGSSLCKSLRNRSISIKIINTQSNSNDSGRLNSKKIKNQQACNHIYCSQIRNVQNNIIDQISLIIQIYKQFRKQLFQNTIYNKWIQLATQQIFQILICNKKESLKNKSISISNSKDVIQAIYLNTKDHFQQLKIQKCPTKKILIYMSFILNHNKAILNQEILEKYKSKKENYKKSQKLIEKNTDKKSTKQTIFRMFKYPQRLKPAPSTQFKNIGSSPKNNQVISSNVYKSVIQQNNPFEQMDIEESQLQQKNRSSLNSQFERNSQDFKEFLCKILPDIQKKQIKNRLTTGKLNRFSNKVEATQSKSLSLSSVESLTDKTNKHRIHCYHQKKATKNLFKNARFHSKEIKNSTDLDQTKKSYAFQIYESSILASNLSQNFESKVFPSKSISNQQSSFCEDIDAIKEEIIHMLTEQC